MNNTLSPVASQRTCPSRPLWSYRCRAAKPQRRWCVHTGRSPGAWVRHVCTRRHCPHSRWATGREGNHPLYTTENRAELTHQALTNTSRIHHFAIYVLTSTSNRVDPYPGHSLMMLMYFSMAWCCGMPCSRVHFSRTLVRVADVSSFTHISSICSSSTCSSADQPIKQPFNKFTWFAVNWLKLTFCFFREPVLKLLLRVPSRKLGVFLFSAPTGIPPCPPAIPFPSPTPPPPAPPAPPAVPMPGLVEWRMRLRRRPIG